MKGNCCKWLLFGWLIAGVSLSLGGCKKNSGSGGKGAEKKEAKAGAEKKGVQLTAADMKKAAEVFKNRCSSCHGEQGKGDGPAARGMNPKPRDFHDVKWQKSVTDEQIEKVIVYGGASIGKSAAMVANPDLGNKPKLLKALVAYIRQFGKKGEAQPKGGEKKSAQKAGKGDQNQGASKKEVKK